MKLNFKNAVMYPLAICCALLSAYLIWLVVRPPEAGARPPMSPRIPVLSATVDTLRCNNLKTEAELMVSAKEVVAMVGRSLGYIADARQPAKKRQDHFELVLKEFDDPANRTIEVFPSFLQPERKRAIPVREYFERFLHQDRWVYEINWHIDTSASRITYQDGLPRCEIAIRQSFKRYALLPDGRLAVKDYEDLTSKTVFLLIRDTTNCKGKNRDRAYDQGCCIIKVGDIKALDVQTLPKQ